MEKEKSASLKIVFYGMAFLILLLFEVDCFAQIFVDAKQRIIAKDDRPYWLGGVLFSQSDSPDTVYYPITKSIKKSYIKIEPGGAYPLPASLSFYRGENELKNEFKIHIIEDNDGVLYATEGIMFIENNEIKLLDKTEIFVSSSVWQDLVIENIPYKNERLIVRNNEVKEIGRKKVRTVDFSQSSNLAGRLEKDRQWMLIVFLSPFVVMILLMIFKLIYSPFKLGQATIALIMMTIGIPLAIGCVMLMFAPDKSQVGTYMKIGPTFMPLMKISSDFLPLFMIVSLSVCMAGAGFVLLIGSFFEIIIDKRKSRKRDVGKV